MVLPGCHGISTGEGFVAANLFHEYFPMLKENNLKRRLEAQTYPLEKLLSVPPSLAFYFFHKLYFALLESL